jgi:hypothetical protein
MTSPHTSSKQSRTVGRAPCDDVSGCVCSVCSGGGHGQCFYFREFSRFHKETADVYSISVACEITQVRYC